MTLDEAIERCKTLATKGNIIFSRDPDIAKECNEKYRQLAEWLEELKAIRNLDKTNFSGGYNKGIDDCLNIIENCCWKDSDMLVELVKELKGGGSSE